MGIHPCHEIDKTLPLPAWTRGGTYTVSRIGVPAAGPSWQEVNARPREDKMTKDERIRTGIFLEASSAIRIHQATELLIEK
jgi:hypothetical protein